MDLSNLIRNVKPEESKEMSGVLLPKGDYEVLIEKIEPRQNDNGWKALNFQLRVISSDYHNAVLFDLVTIANTNTSEGAQKGVEIGLMRLARIAELAGSGDTTKMLGKKMIVTVGIRPDQYLIDRGEENAKRNVIYTYKEVVGGSFDKMTTPSLNKPITADEIPF